MRTIFVVRPSALRTRVKVRPSDKEYVQLIPGKNQVSEEVLDNLLKEKTFLAWKKEGYVKVLKK